MNLTLVTLSSSLTFDFTISVCFDAVFVILCRFKVYLAYAFHTISLINSAPSVTSFIILLILYMLHVQP